MRGGMLRCWMFRCVMRQVSDGDSQVGQRDHDDAGNRLLAKAKGEEAVRADSGVPWSACPCSVRRRWFSSCSSRILQGTGSVGDSVGEGQANTPCSTQRPRAAASGWAVRRLASSPTESALKCTPCVMRPRSLSDHAPRDLAHRHTRWGAVTNIYIYIYIYMEEGLGDLCSKASFSACSSCRSRSSPS
jgi:hypothetical protein